MANKTLNTRIKLKYDTLANWQGDGASVVLLKGEVAVCEVPTGGSLEQVTPPAILFKVGDGVKTFAQLPWSSALAADVYAWAKAATKPTYDTSEITGLTTALEGKENVGTAAGLIAALDSEAEVQSGKFITGFELVDGKVTNVQYGEPDEVALPEYTLEAGTDGSLTLKKDGVAVSENIKVTGWDTLVTNIAAKYTKPEDGIPKTDLAGDVQTSLGKADTAIQQGALDGAIETHNTSGTAHTDIRGLISTLSGRVDGLGNALHFVGAGASSARPEDGEDGDVYVDTDDGKEYVWANGQWNEFGSGDHITKAQADGYYDAKGTAQGLINGLDKTDAAVVNQYVTAVSETDGIITVERKQIAYSEISGTPTGKILDAEGTEIYNPTQAEDTTITIIDCGSATELVD